MGIDKAQLDKIIAQNKRKGDAAAEVKASLDTSKLDSIINKYKAAETPEDKERVETMMSIGKLNRDLMGGQLSQIGKDIPDFSSKWAYDYLMSEEKPSTEVDTEAQMYRNPLATEEALTPDSVVVGVNVQKPLRGANLQDSIKSLYDTENEDFLSSKHATASNLVDKYGVDADGYVTIGDQRMPRAQAEMIMQDVVEQTMHPTLMQSNKAYRDNWFIENTGFNAKDYLMSIDETLAKLQQTLNTEGGKEIDAVRSTTTALQMAENAGIDPAIAQAFVTNERYGGKAIRDMRDQIRSLVDNDFGSGVKEGFDAISMMTAGLNDLMAGVELNSVLNKAYNDEPLTEREKIAFEAYVVGQQIDELEELFGGRSWINRVGQGVGTSAEMAVGFMAGTGVAGSIGKLSSLPIRAAAKSVRRAAQKGTWNALKTAVVRSGQLAGRSLKNVVVAEGAGLIAAPLLPSTYATFAEKRNEQFSVENGRIVYKPTRAWKDVIDSWIEGGTEIGSEVIGARIGELIGGSARAFGRALALDKLAAKAGVGKASNMIFGWQKPTAFKALERSVGYQGAVAEPLSEVWGDALSNLMKEGITGNGDLSQLKDVDYWTTTLATCAIYGGSLQAASAPHAIARYSAIAKEGMARKKALSKIGSTELHDKVVAALSIDNIDDAAKAFASIDWGNSNYHRIDIGYAMDALRADYAQRVAIANQVEDGRMSLFLNRAEAIENMEYRGTEGMTPKGVIKVVTDKNGVAYTALQGDKSKEFYICLDANGNKVSIPSSTIDSEKNYALTDQMMYAYSDMYSVSNEQERQRDIIAQYNRMRKGKGSAEAVKTVMDVFGVKQYRSGDDVTLVNGETATVEDFVADTGEFIVSLHNGGMETVPFYAVLSESELTADAQKLNNSADVVTNVEAKLDVEERVEAASEPRTTRFVEGDIVVTPTGAKARVREVNEDGTYEVDYNTEEEANPSNMILENYAEADLRFENEGVEVASTEVVPQETEVAEIEQTAPESNADATMPEAKPIPQNEDGSINFDAIEDAEQFATLYEREVGSREAAMADVVEMRDSAQADLAESLKKGKKFRNANDKIANRKAQQALAERVDFYNKVLDVLAPAEVVEQTTETPAIEEQTTEAEVSVETPSVGLIRSEMDADLRSDIAETIDAMAKALGVRVRFVDAVADGTANAEIVGNEVRIAWMKRDSAVSFLIGHEFTHRMQDLSPEAYAAFKESVKKYLGEEVWNARITETKKRYKNISEAEIEDETLADFVGEMAENEGIFVKYLEANKENKSLLESIAEVFKAIFEALAKVGKRNDAYTDVLNKLNTLISTAEAKANEGAQTRERRESKRDVSELEAERSEIEERAKADGTWLKAPNGKDTNLTPEQWVTVRTKAFKAWFGDWLKAARIEKLRKSESVVISENANEGKYELNRESAESYILNGLRGEYVIADTNEKVTITRKGAKKVTSHSVDNIPHLKSIAAIPEMLQNAIFIDEAVEDANKKNKKYDAYRYYMCGLRIGNEDYTVRITIGVKSGKYYYDHSLTNIEKGNLIEIAQGFTPNGGRTLPSYAESKDKRIIPLLQTNSSKIVDENGEPKVVYHGDRKKARYIFSTDTFFTPYAEYAKRYTNSTGEVYVTFLDIKRPFDIRDKKAYDIFTEFRGGRTPVSTTTGAMDWGEYSYEDLQEYVEDIAPNEYDGFILDEGADPDGNGGVVHRGLSFVPFTPNQIKSATENIGTFDAKNPDIRYSLRGSDLSLVGVHNLSLDKLRKVIKMGGLANPSVAVINVDKQTHDDYGEYSLILPNNMVDARKGKNAGTWAGDAWTPTYPHVVKRMTDDKAISRFYKDIDTLPDAMRSRIRLDFDSFMEGRSANSLAYWYLFEKGNAPALVYIPSRYPEDITNAVEEATNGSFSMYGLTPEERAKCLDAYIAVKFDGDRVAFETEMQERIDRLTETIETKKSDRVKKWAQDTIDSIKEYGFDYDDVAEFIRDVEYDAREKGKVNIDATITAAREQIETNNLNSDYDAWRNNLDERYGIEEYIFDGYTNSGNRRYLPHTVENASKWMKKQGRQGAVATFPSFSTFIAVAIPKMTSLESIRKRKALLGKSKEEYDAFREKWENVYYELGKKLMPDAKGFDDYGYWRLIEAVGDKNPKAFIKKEYNIELSEEDMAQLNDMLNAIRTEYPARYFETKFERPLQLSDFVAAVVPNDMPNDVYGRLKDANIEIFEYDKNVESSRQEALLEATDNPKIRFSKREDNSQIFYSNAQYAVQSIKQEKATPEQWLKMIEKAGGLKTGEDKWLGLSDWLKASDKKTLTKDEVLQYIAENDIQIEEVQYSETDTKLLDRVGELTNDLYYVDQSINDLTESITRGKRRLKDLLAEKEAFDNKADALKQDFGEDSPEYKNHLFYDSYTDNIAILEARIADDERYYAQYSERAAALRAELNELNTQIGDDREINSTRLDYTTKGLGNKREIALVVPTIEPYNAHDKVHFGDAGEGRAVAWVRFGDTIVQEPHNYSPEAKEWNEPYKNVNNEDVFKPVGSAGKDAYVVHRQRKDVEGYVIFVKDKPISIHTTLEEARIALNDYYKQNPLKLRKNKYVLVIDEIQSKRHQDGRERGYRPSTEQYLNENGIEVVETGEFYEFYKNGELDKRFSKGLLRNDINRAKEMYVGGYVKSDVPSAPFEKNWAELAMKRMIRYAAENGFDYVAWTTGDQQAERYNIGTKIERIEKTDDYSFDVHPVNSGYLTLDFDEDWIYRDEDDRELNNKHISEIFGKDIAKRLQEMSVEEELSGDGLRIGGEGMKAFYDQMLPSFVKKYTKKWGAEVKDITMPDLEENNTMHAVNVTDSMRESVMQGQPKFSMRDDADDVIYNRASQILDLCNKANIAYGIKSAIVVAATREDFVNIQLEAGYSKPDGAAMAAYLDDDDVILLNSLEINTTEELAEALTHENTHSVTHTSEIWNRLALIHDKLNAGDIRDLQQKYLPDYNEVATIDILDEIISNFVAYLSTKKVDGVYLLRGYLLGVNNVDALVDAARSAAIAHYGDKYAHIVDSLLPLLTTNLKIQKERYEKPDDSRPYNFIRHTRRSVRPSNASRGTNLRGNFASSNKRAIDRRGQEEATQIRGGEEVASRLSVRDPDMAEPQATEEMVRVYMKRQHQINKANIRKKYKTFRDVAKQDYKEKRAARLDKIKSLYSNVAKVTYILGENIEQTLPYVHQAFAKIARGEVRIKWDNSEDGKKRGLAAELGLKKGEKRFFAGITKGATLYFDEFVHQWWQELDGYENDIDTQDLRNALIEALGEATNANGALSRLREIYDADAARLDKIIDSYEREEERELAEEVAHYEVEVAEFENNKEAKVAEFEASASFFDELTAVDGTLSEIRTHLAKIEERTKQRIEGVKGKLREMREAVAEVKKLIKETITSKTLASMQRNELRGMLDKLDKARSLADVQAVAVEVENTLLEVQIREKRKDLDKMLQLRLPNGENVEEWINTQVEGGRMSASDARKVLDDMWRGKNATGVRVSKWIDEGTAKIMNKLRELIQPTLRSVMVEDVDAPVRGEYVRKDPELSMGVEKAMSANEERINEIVAKENPTEEETAERIARGIYDSYLRTVAVKQDIQFILEGIDEIKMKYYGMADKKAARDYQIEKLREELADAKRKYAEALDALNNDVLLLMREGKDALSAFRMQQDAHKRSIIKLGHEAIRIDAPLLKKDEVGVMNRVSALVRGTINASYWTFQTTLKEIDRFAPNGEGAFYKYFMGAWQEASNNMIVRHSDHCATVAGMIRQMLNIKGGNDAEIIRKAIEDADSKILGHITYATKGVGTDGTLLKPETMALTASNIMYIIAMWRQPMYRNSLIKHGIEQQTIDTLYGILNSQNEGYVPFMNWVNESFLPDTRLTYDKVHKELFGASMAKERNYFPARVVSYQENVDVGNENSGVLPSTITGAIISRKKNAKMPDITQNYFKVLMGHLQDMDRWSAFAPLIRDLNTLLSNTDFKNALRAYKSGTKKDGTGWGDLYNIFRNVSAIAVECYRPKSNDIENALMKALKGWAASNISYRLLTAIKQLSSSPIFAVYALDPAMAKSWAKNATYSIAHPKQIIEWARENSPSFRKRWEDGFMGMDILSAKVGEENGMADLSEISKRPIVKGAKKFDEAIKKFAVEWGMAPNKAVDALAVASGLKAVYEYKLAKIMAEDGNSEATEAQKAQAMKEAEIAFNTTQQSSEGAYLSTVQSDRSIILRFLTLYQNSPFAFHRLMLTGANELYKQATDAEYKKVVREEYGDAVLKEARRKAYAQMAQAAAGTFLFTLMGVGIYNLFELCAGGEDDGEEYNTLKDNLWAATASMMVGGFVGGSAVISALQGYNFTLSAAWDDLTNTVKRLWKMDRLSLESVYTTLNLITTYRYGVDLDTFMNIAKGVDGIFERTGDAEAIMQILNAPQSQINLIAGMRREGESAMDYVVRRMRIQSLVYDPEYKDIFNEKGTFIGSRDIDDDPHKIREYQARKLLGEYDDAYTRNVVTHFGGKGKLSEMAEHDANYKAAVESLNWKPEASPSHTQNIAWGEYRAPIENLAIEAYAELAEVQERIAYLSKNIERFGGSEEQYYEMVEALDSLKVNFKIKYDELIK